MRFYSFSNMYLSSLQVGLQSAHVTHELFNKYINQGIGTTQWKDILDWSQNYKTMILLNGGYSDTLRDIYDGFEDTDNPYPYTKFHESEDALDGALTCVGIILPEEIYTTASEVRNSRGRDGRENVSEFNEMGEWTSENGENTYNFSKFQVWLINELNKYGLAK